MLAKYLLTVILAAVASAAPSNPTENPAEAEGMLDKRCTNWKAKKGECDKDWGGNCYNACVREGLDRGCKKSKISSDIVDGGCWNPFQSKCSCHCC